MSNIDTKSSKEVVLEFFEILFNKERFDLKRMDALLAEDFEQHYDGKIRTRAQIYKHFRGHETMKQTSDMEFVAILENKDIVFAHYVITTHKENGDSVKWTVLGKFTVKDNQVLRFEQLSGISE